MAVTTAETNCYLEEFERIEKERSGRGPSWLAPVRKAAFSSFIELGFPATRDEEWRFTNVGPIAGTAFRAAGRDDGAAGAAEIRPYLLEEIGRNRLVFVNGYFVRELSVIEPGLRGVRVMSLAATLRDYPDALVPHLTRHADYRTHAFTALNTAFMEDGAFVYIPRRKVLGEPIHLLFVSTAGAEPAVSHPRNLIVADAESQATIVESYVGLGDAGYFTNAVTELVAGENSVIDHYRVEQENDQAFHIGTTQIHQFRSSNVTSHALTVGGALVRNDVNVVLDGEGCDCVLNGLFLLHEGQHADNHLVVEHAQAHCNSREFYKGILDGRSRGVFSGRIIVRKGAQKTDAKQTNMNLLLSEGAQIDSKPQLEIFADDVKCTHGATIGQVDEDAIFYLRSRGIGYEAARSLLVYAFAAESLGRIRIEAVRERLRRVLFTRLPQGQLLEEAV